jgi:hypothetical protein
LSCYATFASCATAVEGRRIVTTSIWCPRCYGMESKLEDRKVKWTTLVTFMELSCP